MADRAAHPAYGQLRPVTGHASVVLANNPSPLTLEGTNTWLLRAPDAPGVVVVDPGPRDEAHLGSLAEHGPVALVLLTHRHADHTEGVDRFTKLTGAEVRAVDPELCTGPPLTDGTVIEMAGLRLRVLTTPGHTSDSACFVLGDEAVLTGDTVLGRGTTVIAPPDGRLADYLVSLRRLADLPPGLAVLPGHGPERADIATTATEYLRHREQRLDQIRAALDTLGPDATARQIVELVYADTDPSVWAAAEWSVQAQLDYLKTPG